VQFNIRNIISILGDNESAIQYLLKSSRIKNCKSSGTTTKLYHYNIGLLFSSIDLHEDALREFNLAIDAPIEKESDYLNDYLYELGKNYENFKL